MKKPLKLQEETFVIVLPPPTGQHDICKGATVTDSFGGMVRFKGQRVGFTV